jgi:hypothetical protein
MRLSLDDSVRILSVESLKADVHLDEEQFKLLEQAYQQIDGYTGQKVSIKKLDDAFSKISDTETFNKKHMQKQFIGQLLSLRAIKISESEEKIFAEYKKKQKKAPPGVSYWIPIIGNKKIFLTNKSKDSAIYFGIATPDSIDGISFYSSTLLAKIIYKK